MKNLSVFLLIFMSCIVSCSKSTGNISTQESICNLDSIKTLALPLLYTGNISEINDNIRDSIYFKKFDYYGTFSLQKLGQTDIYKGFVDDGSSAGTGNYYFLLSEKGQRGLVWAEDSIFYIKKEAADTSFYIGSIANMRNGIVDIYDFVDNKYQKVFSSLDDTDYEFSTYTQKRALNSLNYEIKYTVWGNNGGLKFENIDINKDGFLDIKFSGLVKAYTEDSKDKIYHKYIEMIFLFNPESSNSEWIRYIPNEKDALPFDIEEFYNIKN